MALISQRPTGSEPGVADLVVVGGGVVGLAAAYAAARAGASVMLVDAALRGVASRAGAGTLSPVSVHSGRIPGIR